MTKYDNKLVFVLCTAFALSAPANPTLQVLAAIYGLLLVLLLAACQVGIFLLKFDRTYPHYTSSMVVLDVLQCTVLVLHNCVAILRANWRKDNDVQATLTRVRTTLHVHTVHACKYVEVLCAHFAIVLLLLFLLLTPMHQELGEYKRWNDVFFAFNMWLELLVVMQMCYTNRMIADGFTRLNDAIVGCVYGGSIWAEGKRSVEWSEHQTLCFFIRMHRVLSDAAATTCGNFGIQLSLLATLVIVVTMQAINVALKTAMRFCLYYDENLHLITAILGLVVIIHVVYNCFIVFSCTRIHDEARKSGFVLSKLLMQLQTLPGETTLKKLLLVFISYCKQCDHFYSVLGFIDINHETILLLLECFSLYIVLVLQFP